METSTHNLRIENPCPFVPTRLNKDGANFFCKSCIKTIVDFRGKTFSEISCSINKNTCGIFTIDQLPGQQHMKPVRQLLFYCFTLLSMLGFSVKPIAAQTTQTKKDTILVDTKSKKQETIATEKLKSEKVHVKTHKKGLFQRKKRHRLIGCPDF